MNIESISAGTWLNLMRGAKQASLNFETAKANPYSEIPARRIAADINMLEKRILTVSDFDKPIGQLLSGSEADYKVKRKIALRFAGGAVGCLALGLGLMLAVPGGGVTVPGGIAAIAASGVVGSIGLNIYDRALGRHQRLVDCMNAWAPFVSQPATQPAETAKAS